MQFLDERTEAGDFRFSVCLFQPKQSSFGQYRVFGLIQGVSAKATDAGKSHPFIFGPYVGRNVSAGTEVYRFSVARYLRHLFC